jgi:hypothetical protein
VHRRAENPFAEEARAITRLIFASTRCSCSAYSCGCRRCRVAPVTIPRRSSPRRPGARSHDVAVLIAPPASSALRCFCTPGALRPLPLHAGRKPSRPGRAGRCQGGDDAVAIARREGATTAPVGDSRPYGSIATFTWGCARVRRRGPRARRHERVGIGGDARRSRRSRRSRFVAAAQARDGAHVDELPPCRFRAGESRSSSSVSRR